MKLARVFSAGAGCSSAFHWALAALIFASVPYGRSQAPAAVTTSRPLPDVLGIHLGMSPRGLRRFPNLLSQGQSNDSSIICVYHRPPARYQRLIHRLAARRCLGLCRRHSARCPDGKRRLRFSPNSATDSNNRQLKNPSKPSRDSGDWSS